MQIREELINERAQTDGYLDNLLRSQPPTWVQEPMLEQIALFPRIVVLDAPDREYFDGPLFEELELTFGKATKNDELAAPDMSADIIDGMLRAEGNEIPMEDYQMRGANMGMALDEMGISQTRTERVNLAGDTM